MKKAKKLGTCAGCGQEANGSRVLTARVELGRRGEPTLVRRVYHADCVEKMSTQELHDRDNGGRNCSAYCKRTHALHLETTRVQMEIITTPGGGKIVRRKEAAQ